MGCGVVVVGVVLDVVEDGGQGGGDVEGVEGGGEGASLGDTSGGLHVVGVLGVVGPQGVVWGVVPMLEGVVEIGDVGMDAV